jgi:hypothetical protein
MPIVRTFNMKRIKHLIMTSDVELQQYIECLKEVSDGWERLTKDAVAKLRKQKRDTVCPADCMHRQGSRCFVGGYCVRKAGDLYTPKKTERG